MPHCRVLASRCYLFPVQIEREKQEHQSQRKCEDRSRDQRVRGRFEGGYHSAGFKGGKATSQGIQAATKNWKKLRNLLL
jgi:hypothetical protein